MAQSQPYVLSGILPELERYLGARGVRYQKLAGAAGLKPSAHDSPIQQLSLNATMAVFDQAARALGDPAFGINFARSLRPGGTGLIGEIVLTAPTVRDGLRNAARFIAVFMSPLDISFFEDNGIGRLQWRYLPSATAPRVHYNLFLASALTLRVRAAAYPDWIPLAVELDHLAPDCPAEVRAMFGNRVRFDADASSISFDGTALAQPMPDANATRLAINLDLANRWLAELTSPPIPEITASTRAAIASLLKTGKADLERVAGVLGISPGALQWRLERAGATFEKVLTEQRRTQAESLLLNTDKPLTDIAHELGFSDQSAFSRAAQRWFKMSPRAWRKTNRSQP